MFFGFITGGLARLAVPGPDPMPVWLTVAIGLVGSAVGGAIAIAIWGRGTQAHRNLLTPPPAFGGGAGVGAYLAGEQFARLDLFREVGMLSR